jgi:ribonuclease BN (tRNA processing enzyme)
VQVRLLGSGGWVPTPRRLTSCLYVRDGSQVLLVDAGMGVGRLFDEPKLLDGVDRLDVLLTHWHLDHAAGLGFLTLHEGAPKPTVWAPGTAVMGASAEDLLGRLLGSPFFSQSAEAARGRFAGVEEVEEGSFRIGAFELRARVQRRHATPTLAYRHGSAWALCTDTGYDDGNVSFVRGVRVLLHEAVYAADRCDDEWHCAAGDAARIAAAADVGRLVLIHTPPGLDDDELAGFARARFGASEAGRDGPLAV